MKLNTRILALALGLMWGTGVFIVASINLFWPNYGAEFLEMLSSLYPGYWATSTLKSVAKVTLYSAVDAALFGLVFGWLYNRLQGLNPGKN